MFGTAYGAASNDPVRVFRSTDQGQTWTVVETQLSKEGDIHGIQTIVFRDTLNGFIGSKDSVGEGNTLVQTTDGGQTWMNVAVEGISEIPQNFGLSQNFPNPFSASTRIQFTLDRRTLVKLKVFDMLGIEVAVPVNEALGPGVHEAVFEAGGLPSGNYLYRIRAGEFVQARKLTINR